MQESQPAFATFDRRVFVAGATGYALAVSPATAWAVTTPATNLVTEDVKIQIGKDSMPAYIARPKKTDKDAPSPCVIVVHEIFGVHEYIKDVCRRLANEGYYAIAPDLFFRYGDATKIDSIDKLRAEIVSKVTQQDVMRDMDAVVGYLEKQKHAKAANIGVTGFCWGGNVTWMYSAHNPKVKAGVAWYGRLAGETSASQPKFPVDIAPDLKVPVLGLYGDKDQGIPLTQVDAMRASLKKGKTDSKIIVYQGAEHAFHADYRPSYNEKAAKEGWQELLAWFKKHDV